MRFKPDQGHEKIHRRSIYTFWKRTSPPPQMSIADAPSRESCAVRRERTNTPLLALMLMNDPQYLDAARNLAALTLAQPLDSDAQRIEFLVRRALLRDPRADELTLLQSDLNWHRDKFTSEPERAAKLLSVGPTMIAEIEVEQVELAAWMMIANTILNLDEFITKN